MCTVCGCGDGKSAIEAGDHHHDHSDHDHHHAHGHDHGHDHAGHHHHHGHHHHDHDHDHGHHHHHGDHAHDHHHAHGTADHIDCAANPAGQEIAGLSSGRIIQIERDILGKNNRLAAENRARFAAQDVLAFNFVSSPGAGKTSVLVRAVSDLKQSRPVAVIEGDQQTSNDAERIRATGVPAIQINTGKGCHLDAAMVGEAYGRLPSLRGGLLFIENVGNLVCPAAFDLGEACKIVVFSTTEGEDKPLKYPDMFAASALMLINKIDLAPVLDFDLAQTVEYARRVNPRIEVLTISAKTGEGFSAFYAWIRKQADRMRASALGAVQG
ncbi:hydrogenase-3 accessory protein for metallocenter assembly with P-loop containing NTP hydrolase domain [Bradyrhizobium sp. ORS 375]|uniref:hydrogenase nickel incorporation protein HypB n=1 Tax=Bradyrhizobium sp. (strain ORS 375) TaxID=566679 RepID=UPI0002406924|nr:hydrogenase nickel incorporation protein HypB [Bradyrhizobium sp. ORS 375]CCD93059.1 hydrogenase-3 accessory protein for metallocenter assembly with P-loop containing NTP hydrolase domain [Bradyrhizobium sp. ORS 375]